MDEPKIPTPLTGAQQLLHILSLGLKAQDKELSEL